MKTLRPYQEAAVKECWEALRANNSPVLLMASVGAGKSLMLAKILLTMQKAGKKALCLVNNAELVRNNCETLREEGGIASIYCAALGEKDASAPVVFGTPQSILNGINKNDAIATIRFNLVVVDEAHNINVNSRVSGFMRILRHYRQEYNAMRLLGATGTNFRFKGSTIVGEKCLFKSQVGNITTEQLINDGYLIKPKFEVDPNLLIDFSHVKIKKNGQFDQKQLETVIEQSTRLSELICKQVVHIMETQKRRGVFFFATTKKHAFEILSHLPPDESALILGETPQHERTEILEKARLGSIRYLVNIAIISVGVDVPAYDTIAYLRPTESLVLLVQTMGRVLRLSPKTNKENALVLDFAGNIERHRNWDNPLVLDALAQTIDKDKPLVIVCPACQQLNTDTARRCVGYANNKRCDYFFEFKSCQNKDCGVKNDLASRHCRLCESELIDPNDKLSLKSITDLAFECRVLSASYSLLELQSGLKLCATYQCLVNDSTSIQVRENFFSTSERAKQVFYGQFIKKHSPQPGQWYTTLHHKGRMLAMLQTINTPEKLSIKIEEGIYIIKKKHFKIELTLINGD